MEKSNCDVVWECSNDPNAVSVKITKEGNWVQNFLLISDAHFDSAHCDVKLLESLMNQAVDTGSPILIFGDWYDAMQSREDRRRSKDDLKEEYKVGYYVDELVDRSASFLMKYKDSIVMIAEGNHDTAIKKHLESDIVRRLCRELDCIHMGYSCFMRFYFVHPSGGHRAHKDMYYHHGAGGGAIVTKGTMRAQRERSDFTADVYVGGHIHEGWRLQGTRTQLSASGKIVTYDTLHLSIPTLKNEWDPRAGYHVEQGRSPRPIGGMWLQFFHNIRKYDRIGFDALKAD